MMYHVSFDIELDANTVDDAKRLLAQTIIVSSRESISNLLISKTIKEITNGDIPSSSKSE